MTNPTDYDFTGKIISFSTKDDALAVKNCRFQTIQSRVFVTGEIAKGSTTNDWAENVKCAIAWNEVRDLMIFNSEQEYILAMENSYK